MTENGDYSYNDEENDFKMKSESVAGGGGGGGQEHLDDHHGNDNHVVHLNEKANDYIRDCLMEKHKLDKGFPISERLLDTEIETVQKTGRIPTRDPKYVDIYREKPIKVSQKVLVPVREHPKFNFVGKLLGPKGNSLRRLQEETLCKMTVLGRNSMKDRAKEEELRASMDPKYAHLNDDLHVEISTIAPPAEAYARIAYAMAELRKYLIPDTNDAIRQEQLRELMENPSSAGDHDNTKSSVPPYKRTTGGGGGGGGGGPSGPTTSSANQRPPYGGGYRQPAPTSNHPNAPQSTGSRPVMPPKQKVFSILEKARSAMDESYRRYEEPVAYTPPNYDNYSYSHAPPPQQTNRVPYDVQDYEPTDYRRDYYPHSPNYPENEHEQYQDQEIDDDSDNMDDDDDDNDDDDDDIIIINDDHHQSLSRQQHHRHHHRQQQQQHEQPVRQQQQQQEQHQHHHRRYSVSSSSTDCSLSPSKPMEIHPTSILRRRRMMMMLETSEFPRGELMMNEPTTSPSPSPSPSPPPPPLIHQLIQQKQQQASRRRYNNVILASGGNILGGIKRRPSPYIPTKLMTKVK